MQKVLFVTDKLVTGGIERVLLDVLHGLSPDEYDITLLLPCPGGELEPEIPDHVRVRYLHGTDIRSSLFGRVWHYAQQWGGIGPLNRRSVAGREFDIVVAYKASMVGHLSGLVGRKICFVHLSLDDVQRWPVRGTLRRRLLSMDAVVCVSEGVRRDVVRFIGSAQRVIVMPNPVDDERIRRLSEEPVTDVAPRAGFLVISVGRLDPIKRFDRLIEVARLLRDDGLDFEVWIVGDGSQRSALQEQISQYDLDDRVRLMGRKDNPYPYIRMADLFVLTTSAEGYATVLTEALILEVPVVSTRVVGTDEPLGDGHYGRLVGEDVQALAGAVGGCIRCPDELIELRLLATRGREHATAIPGLRMLEGLLRRSSSMPKSGSAAGSVD